MSLLKAFPKIFAVGHSQIPRLFEGEVEITEKVDGSQFAFGVINDELIVRSKGRIIPGEPPENDMFRRAWDVVYNIYIQGWLPDNYVFYGEYLNKPHHNTLTYGRTPKGNIALFGLAVVDSAGNYKFVNETFEIDNFSYSFGMETVPVLYKGIVSNNANFLEIMDTESFLGGTTVEGIVIKNYNKDVLVGGQYLPISCGKYVSEAFKEKHQKNWSKTMTSGGKYNILKMQYRTEARWEKSIQHLRDAGELLGEPKDIGPLIKAIQQDVVDECKQEIMEELWKLYSGDILRNAIYGFPEFYKERLLARSFTND